MSQSARAIVGFFIAPAFPGVLLYLYNFFWKAYGNEAVVFPFILVVFGYAAAFIFGVPSYVLLHRKGIRSLVIYGLLGGLIGPIFYLIVEVLTAYPGTLAARLQNAYGAALIATAYSSVAAIAFWAIAYWPREKNSITRH